MELHNVLVEYNDANDIYTNSGLQFSQYVLIGGNVLMPYLHEHGFNRWFNKIAPGIINFNPFPFPDQPKLRIVAQNSGNINFCQARVIACFICNNILVSSQKYLKDWAIDFDSSQHRASLSLFFVLKTTFDQKDNGNERKDLNRALNELLLISTSPQFLTIGQEVCIESTPFGNRAFLNSYSQGVISNIFGEHNCLLLTDCSSTPGSEGSPVFIKTRYKQRFIFAIVLSCLNWWKGEWVGLTLAANLVPLLRELIPPSYQNINAPKPNPTFATDELQLLATLTKSIVQIVSGSLWGTGVLLDKTKGIFITNSHVIESHAEVFVYWRTLEIKVSVLHRTPDFEPFDLAILKANPRDLQKLEITPATLSPAPAEKGDFIYAVGYPLFPRNLMMRPSITKGSVSMVQEYVVKTTATVLPGSSGGAIFNNKGNLIAITVSNTKMDEVGVVYPRVNLAVPILIISEIVRLFLQNGDPKILMRLHSSDLSVRQQWDFVSGKL
ncbi:hypothetical protein RI129_003863 [Pyrocoelia pectoralis]|uniref:Peroxisomal leader peptide-processing protease n=1 Tax=Pyrocoelia pectoralis TaxID=417401 RepID=A0AAN7VQD2_9COLE